MIALLASTFLQMASSLFFMAQKNLPPVGWEISSLGRMLARASVGFDSQCLNQAVVLNVCTSSTREVEAVDQKSR